MVKHPRIDGGAKSISAVKGAVLEEGEVWASSLPVPTKAGGIAMVVLPTNKVRAIGNVIERAMVNYSIGPPAPADSTLTF
jgi:hypothetical protein